MDLPKEYIARIRFGLTTTTDDFEGDVLETQLIEDWSVEKIEEALVQFTGAIEQVPPAVSAVKVGGRRSYRIERSGRSATLVPRIIHVYEAKLLSHDRPEISILVRCSRGTYIRSLARDLGNRLGWGGAVASLTRSAIGACRQDRAFALHDIFFRSSEFSGV